jgi:uncharacterized membrane protein YfcA
MPYPLEVLILAPIIVLCGYVVLGIGGFGSALVAMPLLALVLPIRTVVPLMLLLDFVGMLTQGMRLRRDLDRREMLAVVPWLLVGMTVGVTALVLLPARALLVALGISILAYAVSSLRHHHDRRPIARWWAVPAGLFGGLFGGMFGTGGAVFAMYYTSRIPDPSRMRATMSAVFVVSTAARLLLFLVSGLLLQREVWLAFAALVPLVLIGFFVGHRLHGRLTPLQVARFISVLLVFSGTSVLIKGLA